MSTFTTAYLNDGRHVDVPDSDLRDWMSEVAGGITTDSLADWYTESGQENLDEIKGRADDNVRCDHYENHHRRVVNPSAILAPPSGGPIASTWVCDQRACLLDALAWVERITGERGVWTDSTQPNATFTHELPAGQAVLVTESASTPVAVKTSGSRLDININDETKKALQELADEKGLNVTEIVRRAVSVYAFLKENINKGYDIELIDHHTHTRTRLMLTD